MMYYDVKLLKYLEIPKWIADRDDWDPYTVFREIRLPFAPFVGLEIVGKFSLREKVTGVEYDISNDLINAIVWDYTADANLVEGIPDKRVREFMDGLFEQHLNTGWKDYNSS